MFRKLLQLSIAVPFLFVVSCSDDDSPTVPQSQFVVEQFPTDLGMWWRYATVDTVFGELRYTVTYDTVRVEVIDSIAPRPPVPPVYRQMVWRYHGNTDSEDRMVFVTSGSVTIDDIYFIEFGRARWPVTYWEFPMHVGSAWSLNPGMDTSVVASKGAITVPSGTFQDGYRVLFKWTALDSWADRETWLVPNVGVVYYRFGLYGMVGIVSNSTWRLIDWSGNIR